MFNDRYLLTKAVMEKRKWQTRRLLPDYMQYDCSHCNTAKIQGDKLVVDFGNGVQHWCRIPYKVDEVVAIAQSYRDVYAELTNQVYVADNSEKAKLYFSYILIDSYCEAGNKLAGWTNKMFVHANLMPHQIRMTNIRLERLQDISEQDCLAEGVTQWKGLNLYYYDEFSSRLDYKSAKDCYAGLIDKIVRKGFWNSNPYVLAYDFELVK